MRVFNVFSHLSINTIQRRLKPGSVGLSVNLCVCPVDCGKTADWICMPFGMVGQLGPGMRQIVGIGDCFTGMSNFWG